MKISKILSYVVLALGILGGILWFMMGSTISKLMDENGVSEARELPLELTSSAINPLYYLTWIIVVMVLIATFITVVSALGKNPAGLKETLIGIVVFIVIVGIGYAMADGVDTQLKDGGMLSASGSKWIGAGLYSFYILAFFAVGLMVVSGVKKLIGK